MAWQNELSFQEIHLSWHINLFLANDHILYILKSTEQLRFSGAFRGYKMVNIGQKWINPLSGNTKEWSNKLK